VERTTILMLVFLTIALGSTSIFEGAAPASALPHVSAPPPTRELVATETPSPTLSVEPMPEDTSWTYRDRPTLVNAAGEPLTADAIAGYLTGRHTGLSKAEIQELAEVVVSEARKHDLEPGLVLAVIQVESACYHRAVSPVGALGLMQILPSTGEELARKHDVPWVGRETLFDPTTNVKLGTAYLKQLSDRYSHVPTALAAYNWGPGRIDKRIRRGDTMPEIYVKQVMRAYDTVGGHLALYASSS
jgi:soluble lytic murein transglycosylase-like protein